MDDPFYKAAITYLSYRPRSVQEVTAYLHKKHIPVDRIHAIITLLQKQKFLDDSAFARMWVHARLTHNPKSQRYIAHELREKGIGEDIIENVFTETQNERKSDFDQAVSLLEKRKQHYVSLPRDTLYRRVGGYLERRGFSYEVIRKSIDQVFQK